MAKATTAKEGAPQFPTNFFLVAQITSILKGVARVLKERDTDRRDADDIAGNVLGHVADCLSALLSPFPQFPPFPAIPFDPPDGLSPEAKRDAKGQYLKTIYSDKRRGSTRLWVEFAAEYLQQFGYVLVSLDADNSGLDDRIGVTLIYGAEILRALLDGADLPAVPDQLKEVAA